MTDVEWTESSTELPKAKGRENFEIWHIGKSGQEIFLTDFASEKTWTLYKGVEFNYTTPL